MIAFTRGLFLVAAFVSGSAEAFQMQRDGSDQTYCRANGGPNQLQRDGKSDSKCKNRFQMQDQTNYKEMPQTKPEQMEKTTKKRDHSCCSCSSKRTAINIVCTFFIVVIAGYFWIDLCITDHFSGLSMDHDGHTTAKDTWANATALLTCVAIVAVCYTVFTELDAKAKAELAKAELAKAELAKAELAKAEAARQGPHQN